MKTPTTPTQAVELIQRCIANHWTSAEKEQFITDICLADIGLFSEAEMGEQYDDGFAAGENDIGLEDEGDDE
jgi:hypothetical protein